jgi:hypothetical protein
MTEEGESASLVQAGLCRQRLLVSSNLESSQNSLRLNRSGGA